MNIAAAICELCAVITANRSRTDDRNPEIRCFHAGGRVSDWKFRVINRAPLLKVK